MTKIMVELVMGDTAAEKVLKDPSKLAKDNLDSISSVIEDSLSHCSHTVINGRIAPAVTEQIAATATIVMSQTLA